MGFENVPIGGDRPPGDDRTPLDDAIMESRRKILDALQEHEDGPEHDGVPCMGERYNIVAFWCHTLGLGRKDLNTILGGIEDYRKGHEEHGHP